MLKKYKKSFYGMGISILIFLFLLWFFLNSPEPSELLKISLEISMGTFFSLLIAFLVTYDKDIVEQKIQEEYLEKLKESYLINYKILVTNSILYYIDIFKNNSDDFPELKDILVENKINIENLIFNFSYIDHFNTHFYNILNETNHLNTKNENFFNKFKNLNLCNYNSYFDSDYYNICKEVEKINMIRFSKQSEYLNPLFIEDEINILEGYQEANYYRNYSSRQGEELKRKFDRQGIVNQFERLNEILEVFKIDLNSIIQKKSTESLLISSLIKKSCPEFILRNNKYLDICYQAIDEAKKNILNRK